MSDDIRMFLLDVPGAMFGGQTYGADPKSALADFYEGGMCDGEVQAEKPWIVVMVEVPATAEDGIRASVEEATCEEFTQVIEDLRRSHPEAKEFEFEVSPTGEGGLDYREI